MATNVRCTCPNVLYFVVLFFMCAFVIESCYAKTKKKDSEEEKWKKKHVTDYNDADLERLYEQWEDADDEPLPDDELPEWKRPQPKIDLSQIDPNDPEGMLKMTKKGKTVMIFATVAGNPTEKESEKVSMIWQSSLHNANIDVQRYVVGSNRVLFVVRDGSLAWPVKDFLVQQDDCESVTIEGKDYHNVKKKTSDEKQKKKTSNKNEGKKQDDKKRKKKEKLIKENIENEIQKNLGEKTEL